MKQIVEVNGEVFLAEKINVVENVEHNIPHIDTRDMIIALEKRMKHCKNSFEQAIADNIPMQMTGYRPVQFIWETGHYSVCAMEEMQEAVKMLRKMDSVLYCHHLENFTALAVNQMIKAMINVEHTRPDRSFAGNIHYESI